MAWNHLISFAVAAWLEFDSDPWDRVWGRSQMEQMLGGFDDLESSDSVRCSDVAGI